MFESNFGTEVCGGFDTAFDLLNHRNQCTTVVECPRSGCIETTMFTEFC